MPIEDNAFDRRGFLRNAAAGARQGRAKAFSIASARPQGYTLMMDNETIDNFFRRGMGTTNVRLDSGPMLVSTI
jgi:hypothetical protein